MGGGGGGGGVFWDSSPKQSAADLLKRSQDAVADAEFGNKLGDLLRAELSSANNRDAEKTQARLKDLLDALAGEFEEAFDLLFGGSVAKRTYVDGLSDVDTLIVLNETQFAQHDPHSVKEAFAQVLRQKAGAEVTVGDMAITVTYPDGMVLQLLPALRTATGVRVPDPDGKTWSNVVKPEKFREALTHQNDRCGGKLVPVIKLAKAVIGGLPEGQRLTGYHVESLAIDAFKSYSGPMRTEAMLPAFFERARELVLKPIVDSSGQSRHLDDYLGAANSDSRKAASHLLDRIAKRMALASASQSLEQWRSLFERDA